jgi:hypothetical protein
MIEFIEFEDEKYPKFQSQGMHLNLQFHLLNIFAKV